MCAALLWQFAATLGMASAALMLGGTHASVSALLGGMVVVSANAAYLLVVGLSGPTTAGATLRTLLRAEALKVTLIVLALWLLFSGYRDIVPVSAIATLIVTVMVWPVALLYRD